MRNFLAANAFFAGMYVLGALLLGMGWVFFVKALHLNPESLRVAIGFWVVAALILTGLTARYVLKRLNT